jgi:hypothetical protein
MPSFFSNILGWFTQTKKRHIMCDSNNANICKHKFAKLPKKTSTQTKMAKIIVNNTSNNIYKSIRQFGTKKYKWISGVNTYQQNKNGFDHINHAKKIYYIHDNGSRPFKVHIKKKSIYIYKGDYAFGKYYYEPYLKVPRRSVFIGANPPDSLLVKSRIGFKNYPGNTILLEYENGNYLFIEREVYMFKPDNKIKYFYSYVGNNDVPYAYAIDDKYTYLLTYREKIANKLLKADEDPYAQHIKKGDSVNIILTSIASNINSNINPQKN